MFGVKFFTENSSEFFSFKSVRRELALLFINYIDENVCSNVYNTQLQANFLNFWKFSQAKDGKKQNFRKHQGLKKVHKISFSILKFFFSPMCILLVYHHIHHRFVH